ncbi:hypothetical protein [Moorena producens]|uniref:hypothetical protein n=1 Tax=Moorena producens TaxID=1155739 RepID=UPI0011EA6E33|nr:hypothetical protein [Moorena producens]
MKSTPNPGRIHLSNAHQPVVGWALLEINPQPWQNSSEQCPPTRIPKAAFQLPNIPEFTSVFAHPRVLVAIAHVIDSCSIMIFQQQCPT